jgi:hypothetical protein
MQNRHPPERFRDYRWAILTAFSEKRQREKLGPSENVTWPLRCLLREIYAQSGPCCLFGENLTRFPTRVSNIRANCD